MYPKQIDQKCSEEDSFLLITGQNDDASLLGKVSQPVAKDRDSQLFKTCNPAQNILHSTAMVKDPAIGRREVMRVESSKNSRLFEGKQLIPSKPSKDLTLDIDDLDIPWCDLELKERIGAGIPLLPLLFDKHSELLSNS